MSRRDALRVITYLAPGLPLALFAACAEEIGRALGRRVVLTSDPTRSAPVPGEPEPFGPGEADVGFLCAPGYAWLAASSPPVVDLVPAALVFDDPRAAGRPVYFAELVVSAASPVRSLAALRGSRWVYNDAWSWSGYFSVLAALQTLGEGPGFFRSARELGSHHAALDAVERGAADCAAIDSNVLALEARRGRMRAVRSIAALGPFPVQPVVVRAALAAADKRAVAGALLRMHTTGRGRPALAAAGALRFSPIAPSDYAPARALVARLAAPRVRDGAARGAITASDEARLGRPHRPL